LKESAEELVVKKEVFWRRARVWVLWGLLCVLLLSISSVSNDAEATTCLIDFVGRMVGMALDVGV
jgi:hypothetical protein